MANWQERLRGAPPQHQLSPERIAIIEASIEKNRRRMPWVENLLKESLGKVNPRSKVLLLGCGVTGAEFPPIRRFFTAQSTIYGFDTGYNNNENSFQGKMIAYENDIQVSPTDIHAPLKALRSIAPFRPDHFIMRNPPIEVFGNDGSVSILPQWLTTIQTWGQYARNMKAPVLITTLTEQGIQLIEQALYERKFKTTGPQVFDQGAEIPQDHFPQPLKLDNFYTVVRP